MNTLIGTLASAFRKWRNRARRFSLVFTTHLESLFTGSPKRWASMSRPDAFLGTVLPNPETPVIDKQGRMTEEWRRALENITAALFGTDGSADVTLDIPTGSYVGGIVGNPANGLTVAGTPAPGYTVTFTLAQNIQTSASPTFVNGTFTGNLVVGGTVDTRDVSIDGAKLDGIETNATRDQTAAEIIALVLTVDGAGSGLDADLLDAQSGAFYLARGNHTGSQALATISDVTVTAANLNALDDGANTALHFHDADRARANHSGTQLASTISDFNTAADARVAAGITTKADKQATTLTDAVTAHAVTDFATTNAALDALGTRINAIHTVLRAAGVGT